MVMTLIPRSKIKVVYVITKSNWGGAQRYVYDLSTHLPKNQFDVVVSAGGNGFLFERLQDKGIKIESIPGLQRDVGIFSEFRALRNLAQLFFREKPDIIHLNSTKAGGLGALAALWYRRRSGHTNLQVIFTVHGWGFREERLWPIRAAIFFISWFASLFEDRVIILDSADFAATRRFIPSRKLALIPNGIEPPLFLSRDEARAFFANRYHINPAQETLFIATIAELTKNKGLHYLIEAVNQMNFQLSIINYQLFVMGKGELREELQNQIRSFRLEDRIHLLGFVPDAARYLKAFDIFILPSVKEGLPYVMLEAMAAGLPIVATRVGGITDLFSQEPEQSGLLINPRDTTGLKDAILDLAAHPEKRERLGRQAKERSQKHFSLNHMIRKTAALYMP